jgi:hypothetical protein
MSENNYSEKRKFPRFPISIPLQYSRLGANRLFDSCTYDISSNGLSFISSEELPETSLLNIFLKMPDNNQVIPLEAQVVWSKEAGSSQYRYGLKLNNNAIKSISLVLRTILSRL